VTRIEHRPEDPLALVCHLLNECGAHYVVVKVADEVEVDISRRAWKVAYPEAAATALRAELEGVQVPYASLATLMATKETYREQDRADLLRLRELARRQQAE
jgi:hypothetical protein